MATTIQTINDNDECQRMIACNLRNWFAGVEAGACDAAAGNPCKERWVLRVGGKHDHYCNGYANGYSSYNNQSAATDDTDKL